MTRAERTLVFLLRLVGVVALLALAAVVMPVSWMIAIHRWLGLGEMPSGPIVEYLARSLSAFYGVIGAICLVVSADVQRYRPLVRFLCLVFAVLSAVLVGVDLAAGMPGWWTVLEGPGGVAFGAFLFFLAHRADSKG